MVQVNMKAAARILLIVTATFILTECFRTFEKRQVNHLEDYYSHFEDYGTHLEVSATTCFENINYCVPTLVDHRYFRDLDGNFDAIVPCIDQLCTDYQNGKTCLKGLFKSCKILTLYFDNIFRSMDFFCSDRGRSLLREYEQSVCYNNFPNDHQYWSHCRSEHSEHTSETVILQCLIRKFTAECGEAVGQIFSAIYNAEPENNVETETKVPPEEDCLEIHV